MTAPLPAAAAVALERAAPGLAPSLVTRSGSRTDTGRWWWRPRVHVACGPGRLVLFAPGPRPYAEILAYTELRRTTYNAVTGELVLAPAPGARVRRLRLAPLVAHQIQSQIQKENPDHA